MTTQEIRNDLRRLMDRYPASSRSDMVRRELGDTITAVYSAGHIDRSEYHDLMGYIR